MNSSETILPQDTPQKPFQKLRALGRLSFDKLMRKPTIEGYNELDKQAQQIFEYYKSKHHEDESALKNAQTDMEARSSEHDIKVVYEAMRSEIFTDISSKNPSTLFQFAKDFVEKIGSSRLHQMWRNNELNSYADIKAKWDEAMKQ
jgi:hypothetical protein